MLVRVRSNVGVWRVDGLEETTATIEDVKQKIALSRPHVQYTTPLSSDPACTQPLDPTKLLVQQGLSHGSMIHCRVDASTCVDISSANKKAKTDDDVEDEQETAAATKDNKSSTTNMRRVIDKDGSIKLVHYSDNKSSSSATVASSSEKDRGFRKGMLPLRDMKMQWTLNEFVALDDQYVFKIKRQESAFAKRVSLDTPSVNDFQSYLRRFNFSRSRYGWLYGRFEKDSDDDNDDKKERNVVVEAIYEPPQEADPNTAEGFVVLDDPMEDTVEQLASMLGLRKVGWIFGHAPREAGFVMSAAEVIMAAELQLEAAGGLEEPSTPFVTVKVTVGEDGNNVSVEAFQVSEQCMAMVAEEALEVGPQPGFCVVNETFTAIQEGKPSPTVENNFFLTVVPIVQHTSELFVSEFPKANRDVDDRIQSHDEMKRQLSKSGSAGWTFIDLLSDFNLLIYLCKFLDVATDMPKICASVVNRDDVPLDDGYKLIIASMAGMDGSY